MSLKTMFWALFGLTDATSFKHGSDSEDAAEVVVSTALFALWLIIAMIVLLNMLIALISHSLLKVKVIPTISLQQFRQRIQLTLIGQC